MIAGCCVWVAALLAVHVMGFVPESCSEPTLNSFIGCLLFDASGCCTATAIPMLCPFFSPCSEKTLKAFAASVVDGSAEPEYKSAPIPEEPTDGGVTVIVGKNFDSIVKDAEKDVLLEVG